MNSVANSVFYPDFRWREGVSIDEPNPKMATPPDARAMIEIAQSISKKFEFVRVDLYNPKPGVLMLGELTLCPEAGLGGFEPEEYEQELGANWDFSQYFL